MREYELLREDVPSLDLTTHWLGFGDRPARMIYTTRQPGVVSGLRFALELAAGLSLSTAATLRDGQRVSPGDRLCELSGTAGGLHALWKTGLNILEFCSGVATRTRTLADRASKANPRCGVFATRKMIPGSRPWAIQAVLDGGGLPHRLGLSETILVFDQHKAFFRDRDALIERIRSTRQLVCEKKILVEVDSWDEAEAFALAGVDGLQFDKVAPDILGGWVSRLRELGYAGILIATGGINEGNAASYAAAGVNGLATSWVYSGSALDIGTSIVPLD
jgi:molybdenum transport protein